MTEQADTPTPPAPLRAAPLILEGLGLAALFAGAAMLSLAAALLVGGAIIILVAYAIERRLSA